MPRTSGRTGDGAARAAPSALPPDEQRAKAHDAALRLLASRERSEAELRGRLRRKGFDRDVVEEILGRLRETGLQDDARFAERFASEASGSRAYASRRIRGELMKRGVSRELAAAAAAERDGSEDARALEFARARARRMSALDPEVRARRIVGLLARRGYGPETCRRVVRQISGPEG